MPLTFLWPNLSAVCVGNFSFHSDLSYLRFELNHVLSYFHTNSYLHNPQGMLRLRELFSTFYCRI